MHQVSRAAQSIAIEVGRVREANRRFYQAFENLSLDDMDSVWLDAPSCRCVHPGWPMLSGWNDIRESWRRIFENTNDIDIEIHDVTVNIEGAVAWVTCLERVTTSAAQQVNAGGFCASNVFVFIDGEWRMVLHHASHLPRIEVAGSEMVQ